MHHSERGAVPRSRTAESITRGLSLRVYGVVTRTLLRAMAPPATMRRRFERFGRNSRAAMLQRPALVFGDRRVGQLAIEKCGRRIRRTWKALPGFIEERAGTRALEGDGS